MYPVKSVTYVPGSYTPNPNTGGEAATSIYLP